MRLDPKFCERVKCEFLQNVEELGGEKLPIMYCSMMCDDLPVLEQCKSRGPCHGCPALTTMSIHCPYKLEALMEQQNEA
jgi:hypothetical protein